VSERAHGKPLDSLDGPSLRAALPSLLTALDTLRSIDVSGTRGYGILDTRPNRPRPDLGRRAAGHQPGNAPGPRLAGRPRRFPVGVEPFDQAYARLQELTRDLPSKRHIIHGDLVNRNVLVQGPEITAVIDWETPCTATGSTTQPG
jgi:hygromycin-B 4-O-kinase